MGETFQKVFFLKFSVDSAAFFKFSLSGATKHFNIFKGLKEARLRKGNIEMIIIVVDFRFLI